MGLQSLSSLNTSYDNQSEAFDVYCTNLFVGPLIWGIFTVPCVCVGVPASVWLLWVLIQRQHSHMSNDIYMLNLTVMDLIFNVSMVPTTINYLFIKNEFIRKLDFFFSCFNNSGRPVLLVLICVDCYMAVVFPIAYRKMKNSMHRIVACAMGWGLTMLIGITFVLNMDNNILTAFCLLSSYTLAVLIITFCDVSILCALSKPDPSGRTGVHPQKKRALQAITNSFLMTLIAYIPPWIMFHMYSLPSVTAQEVLCNLAKPSLIFPRIGSTIMPLLHLGNLGIFKNGGGG